MQLLFVFLIFSVNTFAHWQEDILNDARAVYSPRSFSTFKKKLYIVVTDNLSVSGSADHGYQEIRVEIYRGALATERLTPDALRMLICHELGHIFGGAPRKNIPYEWEGHIGDDGFSLLSAEGQADYYAGSTCFRELVRNASSKRIEKAGLDFLNLVKVFPISVNTPDPFITPDLIRDSYPSRQCRLDTIVRAARGEARPRCWYK